MTLPNSIAAESMVIGAILKRPDECLDLVASTLPNQEMFYSPLNKIVYGVILDLAAEDESIGINQVVDRMLPKQAAQFREKTGPRSYLVSMVEDIISISDIEGNAKIVRDKAILRQLIQLSQIAIDDALAQSGPVSDIISIMELGISRLGSLLSLNNEPIKMADIIPDVMSQIKQDQDPEVTQTVIQTGFSGIDRKIGGFGAGNLIAVGGWTSQGKTQLMLQIATHNALRDKPVGIFTLEMTANELAKRALLTESTVNAGIIESRIMTNEHWTSLSLAAETLSSADIVIHDQGNIDMTKLKALSRIMVAHNKVELIIIDYIQLLDPGTGNHDNRQGEVAYLSRSAKNLAKELQIPIIIVGQLTDLGGAERQRRPRVRDFRESKAIGHDSNKVLLVSHAEDAEILIAKNREGACGVAPMAFIDGKWYERSFR
jgi:replicative DNA helicase